MASPSRLLLIIGSALLPLAALLRLAAFQWPQATERWYGQQLYPLVNHAIGTVSGIVPVALAELLVLGLLVLGGGWLIRRARAWRRRAPGAPRLAQRLLRALPRAALAAWILAGIAATAFLLAWGLNYARPSLRERLQLGTAPIESEEVLEFGRRAAVRAARLHAELGFAIDEPTTLPLELAELSRVVDARFDALALPGVTLRGTRTAAKPLWASTLLSYLGISGIYIPFTAEPAFNGLMPDSQLPLVVAHEKAHQHGFTDEGEASLVGVLLCAGAAEPYLRYAAYLYAAARLIGEAGRYDPQAAREAWQALGPGPLRDLRAVREFWLGYQGPATDVARRVNDAFLRSNRVPGGVQSYGRVVELLVQLARRGEFLPPPGPAVAE